MRKYIVFFLIFILALSVSMWITHQDNKYDLNICLYANWIDKEIIEDFENKTGLKVNINYCNDYDELEAKLLTEAHAYDMILMSAWPYIERGRTIQLYDEINIKEIDNFPNISTDIIKKIFKNDSIIGVPFLWGYIAIAYSKSAAKKANLTRKDFENVELFFDETKLKALNQYGNIIIIDSPTEFVDLFDMSPEDVCDKMPSKYLTFDTNYIRINLQSGQAVCALGLSDDLIAASKVNNDIEVVLLKNTLIWADLLIVTKKSQNKKNAIKLINFLLNKQIYKQIIKNTHAFSVMSQDVNKHSIETIKNAKYDQNRDDARNIHFIWNELKMHL